jgi:hypothetical protein
MVNKADKSPVVEVAKRRKDDSNIVTLADGTVIRVLPVSPALIDEVTSSVKTPQPPMWFNKDADRDEPNYDHPEYKQALEDAESERLAASVDALVMFGIELVDGLPEGDEWLKKLKFLERRKRISLKGYDLEDPDDKEFLYKRLIAMDGEIIGLVTNASAVTKEDIESAEASFQGD